jgi:hypothetical protein
MAQTLQDENSPENATPHPFREAIPHGCLLPYFLCTDKLGDWKVRYEKLPSPALCKSHTYLALAMGILPDRCERSGALVGVNVAVRTFL